MAMHQVEREVDEGREKGGRSEGAEETGAEPDEAAVGEEADRHRHRKSKQTQNTDKEAGKRGGKHG